MDARARESAEAEGEMLARAGESPGILRRNTDSLSPRCHPGTLGKWSGRLDSNQRPPAPKAHFATCWGLSAEG
jgi:hypothetical protein